MNLQTECGGHNDLGAKYPVRHQLSRREQNGHTKQLKNLAGVISWRGLCVICTRVFAWKIAADFVDSMSSWRDARVENYWPCRQLQ